MRPVLLVALLAGGCEPEKPVGGEEGLERADLGSVTTDAEGGATLTYAVPDAAISSLVLCGPYGYDALMTADEVLDPAGAVAFDDDDPYALPSRVGVEADMFPVLFPTSPDLDVSGGDWTLTLYTNAEAPMTVSCEATYRIEAVTDPATVDIRLVFVGVDGVDLTADSAPGLMSGVLDQFGSIWAGAGLEIGDVEYADFGGDVSLLSVVDGDEELGQLLRTTDDARSITFYFVQDITDDEGATILGLAGGPPGAAANGGTSKSAVVVKAADFGTAEGDDQIARIMAHEGLHFLGLFHTTEKCTQEGVDAETCFAAVGDDPLSDTPRCSNDADGNGTLATSECIGTGGDNIMFWTGADTSVSADQSWVVQRSAAVF